MLEPLVRAILSIWPKCSQRCVCVSLLSSTRPRNQNEGLIFTTESTTMNTAIHLITKLEEGKGPHPQDEIQHLDFTKDPRPLYYKTPPCAFYRKNVCSKSRPRSLVRTKLALGKTGRFLVRLKSWGWGSFPPFQQRTMRKLQESLREFLWQLVFTWLRSYTPARKYYIHKCCFRNQFPEKLHFSYKKIFFVGNYFSENYTSRIRLWFRELHGILVWELFFWKISFQLHEIKFSERISQ